MKDPTSASDIMREHYENRTYDREPRLTTSQLTEKLEKFSRGEFRTWVHRVAHSDSTGVDYLYQLDALVSRLRDSEASGGKEPDGLRNFRVHCGR